MQTDEKLQEFKQIAAALQPTPQQSVSAKADSNPQLAPLITAASGIAAGPTQQRLSGLLGSPEKREIGDCYIWGDWGDLEVRWWSPPLQSLKLQLPETAQTLCQPLRGCVC